MDVFRLLPISDIHYGKTTSDVRKLKRDLSTVDDHTLIIGNGDWMDSICVTDKRYRKSSDSTRSEAILDEQREELEDIFRPVAKQIIGIGQGNHEDTLLKNCNTNVIRTICKNLSTPDHTILYLSYSYLLRLIFRIKDEGRGRSVIIRGHHGWGGGCRTEGGSISKYSHDVLFWNADLFLYGHDHKLKVNDVEEGRMIGDNRWRTVLKRMIVCGTYDKTFAADGDTTWAETKGYHPATIRQPSIFIRPNHDWVDITVQH